MSTLRQIMHIPREILADFSVVFRSIGQFMRSFMRGYVAFFWELVDDSRRLFAPFLQISLYSSILRDFRIVAVTIVRLVGTVLGTLASFGTVITTYISTTRSTIHFPKHAALKDRKLLLNVSQNTVLSRASLQYHAIRNFMYRKLQEADQSDKISPGIILSSMIIFILGCIFFYVVMVFGV